MQNQFTLQTGDAEQNRQITEEQLLAFLNELLEGGEGIEPEVNLDTALAYGYPVVESFFDVSSSHALEILEELARQNILDRTMENRLHLCPECEWHTLNFIELCPSCGGLDIAIQEVIHHFSCAYVGAWSEFRDGMDLICPKCDDELRNIGMDYEKPSETYICNDCEHIFSESKIRAQCLRDGTDTCPEDLPLVAIYSYSSNQITHRAVELGQLYGVDLDVILFEEDTRMVRREYFLFELNREFERAGRYKTDLSLILLWFDGIELIESIDQPNERSSIQEELLESVVEEARSLDLVCNLERSLGAVLLPETSVEDGVRASERFKQKVEQHPEVRRVDTFETTAAVGTIHGEKIEEDAASFVEYVHNGLMEVVRNNPGSITIVKKKADQSDPI